MNTLAKRQNWVGVQVEYKKKRKVNDDNRKPDPSHVGGSGSAADSGNDPATGTPHVRVRPVPLREIL